MNNIIDLNWATAEINRLRNRRKQIGYVGQEDLDCLNKIDSIRRSVTRELSDVRIKLEVCPFEMVSQLKKREFELMEWKREVEWGG